LLVIIASIAIISTHLQLDTRRSYQSGIAPSQPETNVSYHVAWLSYRFASTPEFQCHVEAAFWAEISKEPLPEETSV